MGSDGVEDLRHHTVVTSRNGRADVWKKSRGIALDRGAARAADHHSDAGLDIRLVDAVARRASRFENLLAPPKTTGPPKKLTGPFPKTKLVR